MSRAPLPPPITEHQVYIRPDRMRRVIAVLKGRVYYSVGSDRNRSCLVRTFQRWAKGAKIVRGGDSA